jgi:hypothetical protein
MSSSSELEESEMAVVACCAVAACAAAMSYGRVRLDTLVRASVLPTSAAPLQRVLESRIDSSYIRCFGINVAVFATILDPFSADYPHYTVKPHKLKLTRIHAGRGRPRDLSASQCLALVLAFYRSKCEQHVLSAASGTIPSHTCKYLRLGHLLLSKALSGIPEARVEFPSPDRIRELSAIVTAEFPRLAHAFGLLDGLKLRLHPPADPAEQNAYYNGWTTDHCTSNILLFLPDGTIGFAILNAPGSWHDSHVAASGGLYDTIAQHVPDPHFIVADSAFPVSGETRGKILRRPKRNEVQPQDLTAEQQVELGALRQQCEWGMRAFQASFPRVKSTFCWEELGIRKLMLTNTAHLLNLRTRLVGLNQIRSYWLEHLRSHWMNEDILL